jgi:hypothetical protein
MEELIADASFVVAVVSSPIFMVLSPASFPASCVDLCTPQTGKIVMGPNATSSPSAINKIPVINRFFILYKSSSFFVYHT